MLMEHHLLTPSDVQKSQHFVYLKYGFSATGKRAPVKMPLTIPLIFTVLLIFLLSQKPEGQGKWLALPAYTGQSLLQWFSFSAAPFLTFPIVVRKLFL